MQSFFVKKGIFGLWGILLFLLAGSLWGEDRRTSPLDMFIIIDGSEGLQAKKDEAIGWLCDSVVDTLLQPGDTLTILVAAGTAAPVYSGTLGGADTKEAVKGVLRSITPRGAAADYAGALRRAAESTRRAGAMTYTLVLSGQGGGPSSGGAAAVNLLRYSRVQEFPGWRVQVVGLGIAPQVHRAAAAFMNR
jgi:hypothetical protein